MGCVPIFSPIFLFEKFKKYGITMKPIRIKEESMAEVKISKNEDFERALRGFRAQCKKEGIVKKFRERQYFIKPSERRRTKKKK